MPSRLPNPRFEDFSLTVDSGVWLHQSRWETEEASWFQTMRPRHMNQIELPPPIFHPRKKAAAWAEACWLFKATDQKPTAWADLQIINGARYRHGLLFLDANATDPGFFPQLSPLISTIFLIGRLDLVRIITSQSLPAIWHLAVPLASEDKVLYTLPLKGWRPGPSILVPTYCFDLGRHSWLESEVHTSLAQGFLKHIESRLKRYEQAEMKLKNEKRKRGLLARLFKPRIEDSLL